MNDKQHNEDCVRSAFCDEKKASKLTGLSTQTLMRERKQGRLVYSRIGGSKRGRVFYALQDLIALAHRTKQNI
jgi:hypothetical protein